jgi:cell division protein FtsB
MSRPVPPAGPLRRPWALITALVFLALLCVVLGATWFDSRTRTDQLRAELRQVYAEAESLRTRATQAEQRAAELEEELRALSVGQGARRPRPADSRR